MGKDLEVKEDGIPAKVKKVRNQVLFSVWDKKKRAVWKKRTAEYQHFLEYVQSVVLCLNKSSTVQFILLFLATQVTIAQVPGILLEKSGLSVCMVFLLMLFWLFHLCRKIDDVPWKQLEGIGLPQPFYNRAPYLSEDQLVQLAMYGEYLCLHFSILLRSAMEYKDTKVFFSITGLFLGLAYVLSFIPTVYIVHLLGKYIPICIFTHDETNCAKHLFRVVCIVFIGPVAYFEAKVQGLNRAAIKEE